MGTGSTTGRLRGRRTDLGVIDLGVIGRAPQLAVEAARDAATVAMFAAVESAVRDGRVAIECAVDADGATTMRAVAAPVPPGTLAHQVPDGVTLQVCPACASVHPREVDR
jgi:hypothetical protein